MSVNSGKRGSVAPGVSFNAVEAGRACADRRETQEFAVQNILSLQVMLQYRRVFRRSALLEQIRSCLQKSVWSAGMGFFREDLSKGEGNFSKIGHRVPYKPPDFVRETVERKWQKFKHDVLDSLLMFGFVVVHYQTPKQAGEPVMDERENDFPFPSVVPCELYRLLVTTSLCGGTKLTALHPREQHELPDTVVYSDYGFNPTCDGSITSLVAKAYHDVVYLAQSDRARMRVKNLRCQPTVIIENKPSVNNDATGTLSAQRKALMGQLGDLSETPSIAPADRVHATDIRDRVPFSVFVDPVVQMTEDNLMFRRARRDAAYQRGDANGAAMYGVAEDASRGGATRAVGVATGTVLQEGETARFLPVPSESSDFSLDRHALGENVANTFGVPLGMLMGTSMSGRARGSGGESTSRIVHSMFRLTVSEWRQRVADVLSKAFAEAYFDLMMSEQDHKTAPRASSSSASSAKRSSTYDEKRRRAVIVDFHPTSFVNNNELRELYVWGILDFETFSRYALSNASLPFEERNKHPPEHPLGLGHETAAPTNPQANKKRNSDSTDNPEPSKRSKRSEQRSDKRSDKRSEPSEDPNAPAKTKDKQ